MKISEKLQFIIKISDLTQEKLANQLSVSFATLNSWINERSIPYQRNQKLIDDLYRQYTGQTEIPENLLIAKKELIFIKSKKYKNIISSIIGRQDLFKEFILSLTYNSNSIEGSTLTENETGAILFDNASIPNKQITEHLEAKNHQTALNYLFAQVEWGSTISEDVILKLYPVEPVVVNLLPK
jgi:transcriptional regulator with XRE-family HTH domain